MKAIDRPFWQIINGNTQFVIPVFQRDYSWTEDECAQLFNDVLRVGRGTGLQHFIGSLVYFATGDTSAGFTRWMLIDGQQRVTTLILLLVALRDHMRDTNWVGNGEDAATATRVESYYLKNTHESGNRRYKLILRRNDQESLVALLDGLAAHPSHATSRVTENYQWLRARVAELDEPQTLYNGITRLVVVDVTLDRAHDNPQLVFESLNSTGMDLSQADLIRNYLLMQIPEQDQTRLFEAYWYNIDQLFRGASKTFDAFIRDFMALRTKASKQARLEDIYREFRYELGSSLGSEATEVLLKEMLRQAEYYASFTRARTVSPKVDAALSSLKRLADVAAILITRLLDCHVHLKTLGEQELLEALGLLESYVLRRSVCGMQTRGYWQVFASIAYRLDQEKPLTSLKAQLHRLHAGSYRFPRNDEFRDELTKRDLYSMRNCQFVLERLENHGTKEPTSIAGLSVEHIMPQSENLPAEWKKMLGPEWKNVHQTWLHRLGNLTLTAYNSTYSNRPFEEKKSIAGGFSESAVRLNKYVREQERWTAVEIEARGESLADRALQVWPELTVSAETMKLAVRDDLTTKAAGQKVESVAMTPEARSLFDAIRPLLLAVDDGVIEVPAPKSVAYHAANGEFFLEVLPRKHRLIILLNLDAAEAEYQDEFLVDASEFKFIVNAQHDGGAFYQFSSTEQMDAVLQLGRQAHGFALQ